MGFWVGGFAVIILVLLCGPGLSAQTYVELDIDGVLGNGPDDAMAVAGDTVRVDVYLHHDEFFCAVTVVMCHTAADCLGATYHANWPSFPPVITDSCVTLSSSGAGTFCEPLLTPPVYYASAWYVVEACPAVVEVRDNQSFWVDIVFADGNFAGSVPAWPCVETTGTEGGSWGEIKRLFQ